MSREIALPETVKRAQITIFSSGAGSQDQKKLPIKPGDKEVAILLGCQFTLVGSNISFFYRTGIYKKSDVTPAMSGGYTDFDSNEHWIYVQPDVQVPSVAGSRAIRWQFFFPYPIVLLRPPQWCGYAIDDTGGWRATCLAYYLLQKVTDEQLAKLMVKDHE